MSAVDPRLPESAVSSRAPWERCVREFEQAWQRGDRPALEDFLPGGAERSPLLIELIHTDLELRLKAGEAARAEEYLERFPELADDRAAAVSIIAAEFRLRRRREFDLPADSYSHRFPHLAEPLLQRLKEAESADSVSHVASSTFDSDTPRGQPAGLPTVAGYELLGELGQGGMGVVYKARACGRAGIVALKVLPKVNASALLRFKQEFRTLAGVSHPNLVALYELIASDSQWCFTMELVEGDTFCRYVRGGPGSQAGCNEQRLRAALDGLAEGVAALHGLGKLHRDLKPSNVLVTEAGRVVILDFGLAAELGHEGQHQSTEQHLLGTIAYMSPEQAATRPVSPASDWYSVGVMLYEALTGRLPFQGNSLQVLQDKQQGDPPGPSEIAAGIPADLDALCRELLARDPAARPSAAEIRRRLRNVRADAKTAGAPRPEAASASCFVGREQHLQVLADAFRDVDQGRTVIVLIHGRSGAGKTALMQHFLRTVTERGHTVVLQGRCYEQESVPYKGLDSLVDALSRHLNRLPALETQAILPRDVQALVQVFPVMRRVQALTEVMRRPAAIADPQEVRRRAFQALRELLARLGDRQPLVLSVDDLQWGDVDSAMLLQELFRVPDPPTLLLLAAYRDEDRDTGPFLQSFLKLPAQAGISRRDLAVDALPPAAAQDLASALLSSSGATDTYAEIIARESGGSPFFVHELVQSLQGGIGVTENEFAGRIALDKVLWTRIVGLPEEARRLLEIVAVAGRPILRAQACQAAATAGDGRSELALLRAGRLLRGRGSAEHEEIETYHDRVRETVTRHIAPAELADCHRRLARVLEASGAADHEVLAVHCEGAGEFARAGEHFMAAADEAASMVAFEHAAELYRRALALGQISGERERRLRTLLGDALANAGRGGDAAQEYLKAAAGAPAGELLELQRRAATQYLVSGHIDEGLAGFHAVLDAIGMRLPGSPRRTLWSLIFRRFQLRLRGLSFRQREERDIPPEALARLDVCWSAFKGLSMIDTVAAAYYQARGLLLALKVGEPNRIVRALCTEAMHVSLAGSASRARTVHLIQAAESLFARLSPSPYAEGLIRLTKGVAAYFAGHWRQAYTHYNDAETILRDRCTGVAWELDSTCTFALWSLTYTGEVGTLRERRQGLLEWAHERGDLYASTLLGTYIMAVDRLGADDPHGAQAELDQVMKKWSQTGFHTAHHNAVLAQSLIFLYEGRGGAAWENIRRHWPKYESSAMIRVQHARIDITQLRARSALQAMALASVTRPLWRSAEQDIRRLEKEEAAWAYALARLYRAGLAALEGGRVAAQRLQEAITQLEAVDMYVFAAAARRRLGQLLGGAQGAELVEAADRWMTMQQIKNPARFAAMLAPGFPD